MHCIRWTLAVAPQQHSESDRLLTKSKVLARTTPRMTHTSGGNPPRGAGVAAGTGGGDTGYSGTASAALLAGAVCACSMQNNKGLSMPPNALPLCS